MEDCVSILKTCNACAPVWSNNQESDAAIINVNEENEVNYFA